MKQAGFPSPALEYDSIHLSLDEYLVTNPISTFFIRAIENYPGIAQKNDVLIVDRSLTVASRCLALITLDGELCLGFLSPSQKEMKFDFCRSPKSITLTEDHDWQLWGMVTSVIHRWT